MARGTPVHCNELQFTGPVAVELQFTGPVAVELQCTAVHWCIASYIWLLARVIDYSS